MTLFSIPCAAKWPLFLLLNLLLLNLLLFCLIPPALAAPRPTTSESHPAALPTDFTPTDFTLTDTDGVSRRLSGFRGRPVTLFFFCGCPWCQRCAEQWGRFQRGGALAPVAAGGAQAAATGPAPVTLVVFSGDASAARAFAARTGLDPSQTTLLPDPDLTVTAAFRAEPCPRVFVLNAKGGLRYTNDHQDDAARQAPALAIASHALDALRTPPVPVKPPVALPRTALPATTLDGRPLDLAARPGWKVIYFWSATCPCVRACESFTFVPLSLRFRSKVSFFAVASNGYDLHQPHGQIAHQIAQHKLPFPVLLDDRHLIAQTLGARVTPQAFLLDPQNRVVFAGIPDDSRRYQSQNGHWGVSRSYLSQAIEQALAGHPVSVPTVKDQGCIIAW